MTTRQEPIRGKVAKVLNSREVALNVGANQGIKPGMRFRILSATSVEIRDPDTGATLGRVHKPKIKLRVTRVEPKFAVAATCRRQEVNNGGKGFTITAFGATIDYPKWETRYETLKADGAFEPAAEPLDEKDSIVKIGDPAVQIIGGESIGNRRLPRRRAL